MDENKTPEIESAENEGFPSDLAEALDKAESDVKAGRTVEAKRRPKKTSTVAAADKEPTQGSVDPAASAEPAVTSTTPYATVSGAAVDPIVYSKAVPTGKTGPRRSLTVYHVQRRLHELGFTDAWSETIYGKLTKYSVSQYQESRGAEATGVLTRDQFTALFEGDPNVSVLVDTIADNPVT